MVRGDASVVKLEGELELGTRELLQSAIGAGPATGDLRLDAAGLSFVDCSGLGALVELARSVRASGRHFEITRASRALARLCQLTDQTELLGLGRLGPRAVPGALSR